MVQSRDSEHGTAIGTAPTERFSQEARVQQHITDTINHIHESMGVDPNGPIAATVHANMEMLLDIADAQHQALIHVHELTGARIAKVNIDDVKHIDPEKYEDPAAVAQAIDDVARLEAEKLLATSDFISGIKPHLHEIDPDALEEVGSELRAARKVAGKAIKGSINAFDQYKGKLFSISHVPGPYIRGEVEPLREKMQTYMEPSADQ